MYAVIKSSGQQFKVAEGDTLKVDKLTGDVGSKVTLDQVLAVKTDKYRDGQALGGMARQYGVPEMEVSRNSRVTTGERLAPVDD